MTFSQNTDVDYLNDIAPGVLIKVPGGSNSISQKAPNLRKDFSETFLWEDVEIMTQFRKRRRNLGKEVVTVKVPDSITSCLYKKWELILNW